MNKTETKILIYNLKFVQITAETWRKVVEKNIQSGRLVQLKWVEKLALGLMAVGRWGWRVSALFFSYFVRLTGITGDDGRQIFRNLFSSPFSSFFLCSHLPKCPIMRYLEYTNKTNIIHIKTCEMILKGMWFESKYTMCFPVITPRSRHYLSSPHNPSSGHITTSTVT